jgi:hypothetical protein
MHSRGTALGAIYPGHFGIWQLGEEATGADIGS